MPQDIDTAPTTDRSAQLLTELGLVPEDEYDAAIGSTVKTLRNTPHCDLPAFVKVGRKRFYLMS